MKKFDFSKGFGNIDPKYISEAEGEWKEKKNVWIASFWSKLAAACVILALISTVLSNPKVQAALLWVALIHHVALLRVTLVHHAIAINRCGCRCAGKCSYDLACKLFIIHHLSAFMISD